MARDLPRRITDSISGRSFEGSGARFRNKKLLTKTVLSIIAGMIIGLVATLVLRFLGRGLNF